MTQKRGRILLFPVPMGDVTPAEVLPVRNMEMLSAVRCFVVENVRSARRFLRSAIHDFPIDECEFVELSEHTRPEDVAMMIKPALEGRDIGVLSEAGCPAVADPGSDLVAVAHRCGVEVVPFVGPSSIIMSLMASGFNGQNFIFSGYLPVDAPERRKCLRAIERDVRSTGKTHIFIETPYRNARLLGDICSDLSPGTAVCVAVDITGPSQRIRTMPVSAWAKTGCDFEKVPAIFLIGR